MAGKDYLVVMQGLNDDWKSGIQAVASDAMKKVVNSIGQHGYVFYRGAVVGFQLRLDWPDGGRPNLGRPRARRTGTDCVA
uniref:Uncharacterized protein n=1 Tax=Oryza nivara TaxID=4536 RepID=A0A0E0GYD0_ORYNI